jgi:hypothetical protein
MTYPCVANVLRMDGDSCGSGSGSSCAVSSSTAAAVDEEEEDAMMTCFNINDDIDDDGVGIRNNDFALE